MESLNVLVIEDTERHQEAAKKQLEARGHKVTVASSLIEAEFFLEGVDFKRWLPSRYPTPKSRYGVSECREVFPLGEAFDAVLTDMNLPSTKGITVVSSKVLEEGLVPFGFIFALKAAARGARYVAMITDTGHHDGAISAALDAISPAYYEYGVEEDQVFNVNGARVVFVHAPMIDGDKNWGRVLDDLVADRPDEGGEEKDQDQVLDDLVADRPDDRGWWEKLVAMFRRPGR